ncbi:MAG TPA: SH3 domain-containing protein [Pseudonocardiaceae bacterium]
MSKRLIRQWRWVGIAVVIVALAIVSKSADVNLGRFGEPARCQVEVNADVLNVRAGPSTDSETVAKLSRGDIVDALPEIANGFRKLSDNRWVAEQFVTPNSHC